MQPSKDARVGEASRVSCRQPPDVPQAEQPRGTGRQSLSAHAPAHADTYRARRTVVASFTAPSELEALQVKRCGARAATGSNSPRELEPSTSGVGAGHVLLVRTRSKRPARTRGDSIGPGGTGRGRSPGIDAWGWTPIGRTARGMALGHRRPLARPHGARRVVPGRRRARRIPGGDSGAAQR